MREFKSHFINGEWRRPVGGGQILIHSPADLEYVGCSPDASVEDMNAAVDAARQAFDHGPWTRTSPVERAEALRKIACYLSVRSDELADLTCDQVGIPISFLRNMGKAVPAIFEYYASLIETWPFAVEREGAFGPATIRQEPVGVVAAISPWNGPLYLLALKVAPALAAGCTVVGKPSPEAPLESFYLAKAAEAAGLPPGVLNIVPGGREAGEHLVSHQSIDKVAFTGSTAAGKRIASICGSQIKRCSLELGGKSAAVMLDDASVETLVGCAVPFGLAFNNGEACAALTRILVPRDKHDEVVEAFVEAVSKIRQGDPRDPETQIGPLVAERQRQRVEGYIAAGRAEGARVAIGGGRPAHLNKGWYVEPTVFCEAHNDMKIAQEEIFGPVCTIIPYDGDDQEAIRLANASSYGLGGAIFSADEARAYRAASQIRCGTVGINKYFIDLNCPFGGFKESGIGREHGPEGLHAYLEFKSVWGKA